MLCYNRHIRQPIIGEWSFKLDDDDSDNDDDNDTFLHIWQPSQLAVCIIAVLFKVRPNATTTCGLKTPLFKIWVPTGQPHYGLKIKALHLQSTLQSNSEMWPFKIKYDFYPVVRR